MPAARRSRRGNSSDDSESLDLTPMIDVTFQLIIFFMVVTQITSQENVNLRLPDALAANPAPEDAPKLFTVHIAPTDQSVERDLPENFGWFCYGDPYAKSMDEMRAILDKEAHVEDPKRGLGGVDPATGISENIIVVRCDARCPSAAFGWLIQMIADARIYRIQIAILNDQRVD